MSKDQKPAVEKAAPKVKEVKISRCELFRRELKIGHGDRDKVIAEVSAKLKAQNTPVDDAKLSTQLSSILGCIKSKSQKHWAKYELDEAKLKIKEIAQ